MARRRVAGVLLAAALLLACDPSSAPAPPKASDPPGSSTPTSGDEPATEDPEVTAERGGAVRVAVWGSPDPAASTLAGAGVRGLVLPQLFYAKPDGRWGPLLVEPGSDLAASDFTSAQFRLRAGASWSDGSPIGVDDLRRSADARFVAALEGPLADGTITVRFTQPIPGWRRLWSLDSSVSPPRPGIWGGPFVVASATPGLEVVLHPNPAWPGPRPFLDEVRLVLVPDATTARQLLTAGQVDVVAPPAETRRTPRLEAIPGVRVDAAAADGGWWVGLLQQPDRLDVNRRRSLAATIDRARFVSVLLQGEAERLDGLGGADDATWSGAGWVGASSAQAVEGLSGATVDLVGQIEEPMTGLLHRSMQKRTRDAGGRLELRAAEADRVEGWLAERSYDAAIVLLFDGPSVCWTCRWGNVDPSLAAAADSGDLGAVAALEAKLAAENLVVPLWRPRAVVAWREEVVAPLRANPYGLSPAWDAWRWHRP